MYGILAAMKEEMNYLKNSMTNCECHIKKNILFYTGILQEKNVVIAQMGIGKVNAAYITTMMIENFNIKAIINTGICGGLAPLKNKDIIVADKFIYGDVNLEFFGYAIGQIPHSPVIYSADQYLLKKITEYFIQIKEEFYVGTIITADTFITSKNELKIIPDNSLGIDMESCAIAQICHINKMPFISLKLVSDIIDDHNQVVAYKNQEFNAGLLSAKNTKKVLKVL